MAETLASVFHELNMFQLKEDPPMAIDLDSKTKEVLGIPPWRGCSQGVGPQHIDITSRSPKQSSLRISLRNNVSR